MLPLSRISTIIPYSDEWYKSRLSQFTASRCYCLIEKGTEGNVFGVGALTYIRSKVGEELTGKSSDAVFETDGTVHGVEFEPVALKYWQERDKIELLISDKHIIYDRRSSCTPDSLAIRNAKIAYDSTGENVNAETVEAKCFKTQATHVQYLEADTPEQIKAISKKIYWQVICQMLMCNVTTGNLIVYHPDFPESTRLGHIVFKKIVPAIMQDCNLLKTRLELADTEYEKIKNKITKK